MTQSGGGRGKGAYDTTSNSGNQTGGQLVPNRNRDCSETLRGVADDGEQDETNELSRDRSATSQSAHRMDEAFCSDADKDCDHNKKTERHGQRQLRYLFIILAITGFSRIMPPYFLVGGGGPGRFL